MVIWSRWPWEVVLRRALWRWPRHELASGGAWDLAGEGPWVIGLAGPGGARRQTSGAGPRGHRRPGEGVREGRKWGLGGRDTPVAPVRGPQHERYINPGLLAGPLGLFWWPFTWPLSHHSGQNRAQNGARMCRNCTNLPAWPAVAKAGLQTGRYRPWPAPAGPSKHAWPPNSAVVAFGRGHKLREPWPGGQSRPSRPLAMAHKVWGRRQKPRVPWQGLCPAQETGGGRRPRRRSPR